MNLFNFYFGTGYIKDSSTQNLIVLSKNNMIGFIRIVYTNIDFD